MLAVAIIIAGGLLSVALLLNLYRLLRGPTIVDRVAALDTMSINVIGLVILIGVHTRDLLVFEVALLIAMTGFIGTIALCKYLMRGDIIE
jgi:multicomponent K+:H+ antiporter subunit F